MICLIKHHWIEPPGEFAVLSCRPFEDSWEIMDISEYRFHYEKLLFTTSAQELMVWLDLHGMKIGEHCRLINPLIAFNSVNDQIESWILENILY